ncbi:DinB family protein [Streptomyces sp. NPDC052052]|uniref:DinB family protein n=1 Tax=Streptomyces sp. NPDC052052 TaxID=3154756 RepID=UPI0034138F3F
MTTSDPITRDLLETLDDVRTRTLDRLDGLTDAEYLWQPVASCVTVRKAADGMFRADPRPAADVRPAPFTTIAWRTWHIGADCLRGYGRFFGDDSPSGDRHRWPGTATEGVQVLSDEWSRFRARVASLGDDGLLRPMGRRAGAFGHESYLLLALHALDEAAHHGAEIGVLRDLHLHGFAGEGPDPTVSGTPDRSGPTDQGPRGPATQ